MDPQEPRPPAETTFDHPSIDGRGTGDLVKEIATDMSSLIRKEIELAKLEIREIFSDTLRAIGLSGLALGLVVLLLPLLVLTIIETLAIWLPRWSATLIVTGVVGGLAGLAFLVARQAFKKRAASKFVPEKTVQTIKEDVEWARSLKKP